MMTPNVLSPTEEVNLNDNAKVAGEDKISKPKNRTPQLVWRNIILFSYMHLIALYGFYVMFASAKLLTSIQCKCFYDFLKRFFFLIFSYRCANFNFILNAKYLYLLDIFLYRAGGYGITAGAHRLWSHRSYKAKWPLKIILIILNTLAFEVSIMLLNTISKSVMDLTTSYLRMRWWIGLETIAFIINTLKPMPIPIMPNGGFSSPIWAGCCVKNIRT